MYIVLLECTTMGHYVGLVWAVATHAILCCPTIHLPDEIHVRLLRRYGWTVTTVAHYNHTGELNYYKMNKLFRQAAHLFCHGDRASRPSETNGQGLPDAPSDVQTLRPLTSCFLSVTTRDDNAPTNPSDVSQWHKLTVNERNKRRTLWQFPLSPSQ